MSAHTRATPRAAPVCLVASGEALKPEKGASGLSSEGQLQILGLSCTQCRAGQRLCAPVQLYYGHDERMQQIAVEQPCLACLRIGSGVEVAEAAYVGVVSWWSICEQVVEWSGVEFGGRGGMEGMGDKDKRTQRRRFWPDKSSAAGSPQRKAKPGHPQGGSRRGSRRACPCGPWCWYAQISCCPGTCKLDEDALIESHDGRFGQSVYMEQKKRRSRRRDREGAGEEEIGRGDGSDDAKAPASGLPLRYERICPPYPAHLPQPAMGRNKVRPRTLIWLPRRIFASIASAPTMHLGATCLAQMSVSHARRCAIDNAHDACWRNTALVIGAPALPHASCTRCTYAPAWGIIACDKSLPLPSMEPPSR